MHYRSLITFLKHSCTDGLTAIKIAADGMLCMWFLSLITCFVWMWSGVPLASVRFGMGERLITQYCKKVVTFYKQNYEGHLLLI